MTAFAAALAEYVGAGDCLLLKGTLGAGKTTLARGVIRALCGQETEVVSPTFLLVQEYEAKSGYPVAHYDLYRIEHARELYELGMEEVLGHALVLVEWPDVVGDCWPDDRLEIELGVDSAVPDRRSLQLRAQGGMVSALQQFQSNWERHTA